MLKRESTDSSQIQRLDRASHEDARLVQACLDGAETAWTELVERYGRLVYSIPLRYGLSAADADDVFQTVFTIVFHQLSSLRNRASLTAWLITITHRESKRLGKRTQPHAELDETFEDASAPPPDHVQLWERQQLVHQALGQLDPRCRELLTALFLESGHVNYVQVARRLCIPTGSIGPTRARCFKKFERTLTLMGFEVDF